MIGLRFLLCLLAMSALAACASPLYRPANPDLSSSVGYRDNQLSTGAYQVVFTAPEATGMTKTQDLALLRAADLTLAKGHAWFRLLKTTTQSVEVQRPRQTYQTTTSNMTCNTGNGAQGMGCSYTNIQDNSIAGAEFGTEGGYMTRLVTTLVLMMGDGAAPQGPGVYDAKATADRLRAEMKQ